MGARVNVKGEESMQCVALAVLKKRGCDLFRPVMQ
jgi:hypothetical protein